MTRPHPHALPLDQREQFDCEGFLLIRGVIPEDTVDRHRQRFMEALDRFASEWRQDGLSHDLYEDEDFARELGASRVKLEAF